jgi:hypothetical protein
MINSIGIINSSTINFLMLSNNPINETPIIEHEVIEV